MTTSKWHNSSIAHVMHAYSVIHVLQKETEDCGEGWWEGRCAEHP